MKKWNLIIDVAKCTNCSNCLLANKDEHVGNDFPGYAAPQPKLGHRWIDIKRKERGQTPMVDTAYLPAMCNHCDDAPCLKAGDSGAVRKRADGIVIIDPQKAKGRHDLVEACPYGSIWWNEELQLPQIWIFDAHLLDQGWKEPRCVTVCPTSAIASVKVEDDEMAMRAKTEKLEVLKPELKTRPRVYYRNLGRYTSWFIGGSVSALKGGVEDCLEGALIDLRRDGRSLARAVSDNYGIFRFDNLPPQEAEYDIDVSWNGVRHAQRSIRLCESLYIGNIEITL